MGLKGINIGALVDGAATQAELDVVKSNQAFLTLDNMMLTGAVAKQYVGQAQDLFVDTSGVTTSTSLQYDAVNNRYAPSGAASATLLIHCDGTDASTTFTDSISAKTITANGSAQVDTAQSVFGGASGLFTTTSDFLSLADSPDWDFGAGDFTIDLRVRFLNTPSTFRNIMGNGVGANDWIFGITDTTTTRLYFGGTTYNFTTPTLAADTWYHLALVRSGNNLNLYVDGTVSTTGALDVTGRDVSGSINALTIGAQSGNSAQAHLDEIRLLKGTAVWTSDFTAPTSAYSLTPDDVTFESDPFVATTAPTTADAYALLQITTGTLATDFTLEVRREGASSYATATLTDTGFTFYDIDTAETYNIVKVDDVDLSAQTSGTAPQLKLTSANNPDFFFKGWLMQWG